MNFPSAIRMATQGHPVARAGWATEFDLCPTKWLTRERGVWYLNTTSGRSVLVSGDSPSLVMADYVANDWILPKACGETPDSFLPDFPASGLATEVATFDVYNPPCRV